MNRLNYFFILMLLCSLSGKLYAIPAYPYPIEITQPDGTTLSLTLKGDEFASWAETSDGYTILRNKKGFFEYAKKDTRGDLIPSGIIAKNALQRNAADNAFLSKISKKLTFSSKQVQSFNQLRQMQQNFLRSDASQKAPTITGKVRAPLILVDFPGKPFTKTKADFENLCNQINYSSGSAKGSVRDYFLASSYGQLDFQVDVYGPYTLANPISYYSGYKYALMTEAIDFARRDGCNFANYDSDNDGIIDGVHFIYAGYDQSAGADPNDAIWASAIHGNYCMERYDNKCVYQFSMSSELRGRGSVDGTTITPIGVIAHELSHVFGLPDLYDTDGGNSGGQSLHMGRWDIMADGSWNNDGDMPAYHSALCRDRLGWVPAVELNSPCDIELPNPAVKGAIYKITTTTHGEYFLLENRQQTGWDTYIPASGLLIYHIDENVGSRLGNMWKEVNVNPDHRGVYVKQAGGGAESKNSNRSTDPYPQGANNSFTDTSIPNSKSWAGNETNKPVTNILHNTNERTVSFSFMGGSNTLPRPSELFAKNISPNSAYIYWKPAGRETSWKLYYKKRSDANYTEVTVTTMPYQLKGLVADTEYDIKIKALSGSDESIALISEFKTSRCENMVNYTVISRDDYGDGWKDNALLIKQNGIVVATIVNQNLDGVVGSAYPEYNTHIVPLCPCAPFEAVWKRGYGGAYECSFEIKNDLGKSLYKATTDDCGPYANDGKTFYSGVANCIRTWTPQSSSTAWTTAANWTPQGVPAATDRIIIPQSSSYPILTAQANVSEILFKPGAELGRQDRLTYNKAFVQLDFSSAASRNRWWMLANPLQELYAGDFSFGGYPGMTIKTFATDAQSGENEWKTPQNGYAYKFGAGGVFEFWLNSNDDKYAAKGLKYPSSNGVITLPYFEDSVAAKVHWTHDYNSASKKSTFYGWKDNGVEHIRDNSSVAEVTRDLSKAYKLTAIANNKFATNLDFGKGKDGKSYFAAAGNPFMSSISFEELQKQNSSLIGENYWIWIGAGAKNASNPGSYVVWNKTAGQLGNTAGALSDALVPMQAFIVERKSGASGKQITFDIDKISATGNGGNQGIKISTQSNDLLEIIASTPQSAVRAAIASHAEGDETFNAKDSRKLFDEINELPDIYMLKPASGNSVVAVAANILNKIKKSVTIPLAISTTYEGTITLSFKDMNRYDARIFLIDAEAPNKKEIELTGKSLYEYRFNYLPKKENGTAVANENRFSIRLSPTNSTGIDDIATTGNIIIYSRFANTIQVMSGELIQHVSVFDIQGRKVYDNMSVNAYECRINGLSSGIYVVKAVSKNNTETTKIIVK